MLELQVADLHFARYVCLVKCTCYLLPVQVHLLTIGVISHNKLMYVHNRRKIVDIRRKIVV